MSPVAARLRLFEFERQLIEQFGLSEVDDAFYDAHARPELEQPESKPRQGHKTSEKIAECRTTKIVLWCPCCKTYYTVQAVCRDRLCPYCAKHRALRWSHRYKNIRLTWPVFITLTMIPDNDIAFSVDLALKSFAKIRRQFPALKRGIYALEIGYASSDEGKWRVHLHVLADCRWVDRGRLAAAWRSMTGAYVVDVKRVKGGLRSMVREVCKYTSKGVVESGGFSPDEQDEIGEAIRHRRLISAWGLRSYLDTEEISLHRLECPVCFSVLKYQCRILLSDYLSGKERGVYHDYPFEKVYDTS
jgi:hypothetical protein